MNASSSRGSGFNPKEWSLLFKLLDSVWIVVSLWVLCWLYDRSWSDQRLVAITAVILFLSSGIANRLYRGWRGEPLSQELFRVTLVWFEVMLVLLLLGFATQTSVQYSRLAIGTWFVLVPLMLCISRIGVRLTLRVLRRFGYNTKTVAIAGASETGVLVAKTIDRSPGMGLKLVGFFDDRRPDQDRTSWTGPLQGDFDRLLELAQHRQVDVVYVTLPLNASRRLSRLLDKLAQAAIAVYVVPEIFITHLLHGRWVNLNKLPTISIFETPFYGLEGWMKRLQDILLASLILVVIAVPMIIVGISIKLSSPGPVLFKQRRYGLDGREIVVWKFRTMTVCEDGQAVSQATRQDTRVTRLGAFLRCTSLDELPQFINVLQGRMSIVGPRPHAVIHNEIYRTMIRGYMLRHKVKPGITGWAQVNGWRGETDTLDKMEKRIEHDLWYIQNWSLWLDLKIILLTVLGGFSGKNAY